MERVICIYVKKNNAELFLRILIRLFENMIFILDKKYWNFKKIHPIHPDEGEFKLSLSDIIIKAVTENKLHSLRILLYTYTITTLLCTLYFWNFENIFIEHVTVITVLPLAVTGLKHELRNSEARGVIFKISLSKLHSFSVLLLLGDFSIIFFILKG